MRVPPRRFRQFRALLAGGLVLGLGGTYTLAAWNDSEQASAEFVAGAFEIEASMDGRWGSSSQKTFLAQGMYPGAMVYEPVLLRTTPASTASGRLNVSAAGATGASSGIAGFLEYRATTTVLEPTQAGAFDCSSASMGPEATYVFGGPNNWQPLAPAHQAGSTQQADAAAGNIVAYCFQIRLAANAPNSVRGTTAEHVWTWNAQSLTPEETP